MVRIEGYFQDPIQEVTPQAIAQALRELDGRTVKGCTAVERVTRCATRLNIRLRRTEAGRPYYTQKDANRILSAILEMDKGIDLPRQSRVKPKGDSPEEKERLLKDLFAKQAQAMEEVRTCDNLLAIIRREHDQANRRCQRLASDIKRIGSDLVDLDGYTPPKLPHPKTEPQAPRELNWDETHFIEKYAGSHSHIYELEWRLGTLRFLPFYTVRELLNCHNVGKYTVTKVVEALAMLGFHLKEK